MLPHRPIPESLRGGEFWNDVPDKIGKAMGGREFFFEAEATAIHRIGISLGLGWRLPKYMQRSDGIDYIKVEVNKHSKLLDMTFLHAGDRPPEEAEAVVLLVGNQYGDLRQLYEVTINGQG